MKKMIVTAASRFQREISGDLGDYWKKDAEKRVNKYMQQADEEAIVEEDGAIRWKRSGNYLPDDYCEVLEYGGYDFSREATDAKRRKQDEEFLKQYRSQKHELTDEEKYEMRVAFGEGVDVVDMLSGERYRT